MDGLIPNYTTPNAFLGPKMMAPSLSQPHKLLVTLMLDQSMPFVPINIPIQQSMVEVEHQPAQMLLLVGIQVAVVTFSRVFALVSRSRWTSYEVVITFLRV